MAARSGPEPGQPERRINGRPRFRCGSRPRVRLLAVLGGTGRSAWKPNCLCCLREPPGRGAERKLRILWVKPGKILPLDTGGKLRTYNMLCQLAANHQLAYLSFYG